MEGAEELALSTFPWERHTVSVWTIERPVLKPDATGNAETKRWNALLESHGYRLLRTLPVSHVHEEQIWVHASLKSAPAMQDASLLFCHPCHRHASGVRS